MTREALECLSDKDRIVRSFTTAVAGAALRMSGDLVAAARATTEAIALAEAADARFIAVDARRDLARLQMARGQLRKSAATCRAALRLAAAPAGQKGSSASITGYISAQLCLVLREWNDLEAALLCSREGLEACLRWGQASYLGVAYSALAKTLQAVGDARGARDAAQQARQAVADLSSSIVDIVTAWEMQVRLAQGDATASWRWAQASGLSVDDEIQFHRYEVYCTFAQILIAQSKPDRALTLLARLLAVAETAGAMGCVIEVQVLQAIALQATGRVNWALAALSRALSLAEPEGYVRTFIDEGEPMGRLLRQTIARGTAVDYASRLVTALEAETARDPLGRPHSRPLGGSAAKGHAASGTERPVEPLTERELQVLRLLSTHLSRREMAGQLYVSVNTVRFHVKNIYTKLGVHSRSDAIRRAGELKLLQSGCARPALRG
jgi:LuxR family maltose regulon positive regulatory protein